MTEDPVENEFELHAYVDDRLDAARRVEFEKRLAADPGLARRARDFAEQNRLLQKLFEPIAAQPVPARIRSALSSTPRARWRLAAVAAGLAGAFVLGWFVRGSESQVAVVQSLAHRAVIAHALYTPEVLHPVEVGAAQEAHLVKWLSKRLGQDIRAPDLSPSGFTLVGGRLLPGAAKPAAQLMYQDDRGQRLTLYISGDVPGNRETAFRYAREQGVSVFYWVDGPLGYALSGDVGRERLLAVAEAVYHDLNP